jgi:hypothetical protein
MSKKIAAVCGDPGGARALLPVLVELLKDDQIQVETFAYSASIDIFRHAKVPHTQILENWIYEKIETKLQKMMPHLVFTATSMHAFDIEKKFLKACNNLSIPSLSLIDFWANYRQRFVDEERNFILPTKIAVMDDLACLQMQDDGFPKDRLISTGQPAFDYLYLRRNAFSAAQRRQIRTNWGVPDEGKLIAFFSQPIAKYYGKFDSEKNLLGFDEFEVLRSVIEALKAIEQSNAQIIHLIIFPHPTQDMQLFKQYENEHVRIYSQLEDSTVGILASDLVLGMTSTRLYEALLTDCQVVSLQPGAWDPFHFPPHFNGMITNVCSYCQMEPVIREKLFQNKEIIRTDVPFFDGQSTQRVVDLIHTMLQ